VIHSMVYKIINSLELSHKEYLDLLVKKLIGDFNPKRVLDVGCGEGELVSMFQKHGVETYGIDISKQSLLHARNVVQADAEKIPFKDNTFDLLIAHHSLEHLKNPEYFIRECKRVLKANGIVCVVVPVSPFGLTKLWRALKLQTDPTHLSMHSKTFWVKMFRKEGFRMIGDLQDIVKKDPPSSFWLGVWLIKQGSIGKWLWLRLVGHIRKSFLFKLDASKGSSK